MLRRGCGVEVFLGKSDIKSERKRSIASVEVSRFAYEMPGEKEDIFGGQVEL